jgi:hypothetical protein
VTPYLDPKERIELSQHYQQVAGLVGSTARNGISNQQVFSLSRPIPLDAGVRFSLMQSLDELRGRIHYMDLVSGQLLFHIDRLGMDPDRRLATRLLERSGTRLFCAQHHLPLRSFAEAATPIPYQYSPVEFPSTAKP